MDDRIREINDLLQELDSCWAVRGTYVEGYGKKKYRHGRSYKGRCVGAILEELEAKIKELPIIEEED